MSVSLAKASRRKPAAMDVLYSGEWRRAGSGGRGVCFARRQRIDGADPSQALDGWAPRRCQASDAHRHEDALAGETVNLDLAAVVRVDEVAGESHGERTQQQQRSCERPPLPDGGRHAGAYASRDLQTKSSRSWVGMASLRRAERIYSAKRAEVEQSRRTSAHPVIAAGPWFELHTPMAPDNGLRAQRDPLPRSERGFKGGGAAPLCSIQTINNISRYFGKLQNSSATASSIDRQTSRSRPSPARRGRRRCARSSPGSRSRHALRRPGGARREWSDRRWPHRFDRGPIRTAREDAGCPPTERALLVGGGQDMASDQVLERIHSRSRCP